MNAQQARDLVSRTFPHTFDEGRFRTFALNLLQKIDESKAQAWNTSYVKDAFKDHVKGYKRIGTYTSPGNEKLDVLVVHLTTESKLERTRTALRNFVADHLKTRDHKDAALVAFVSPTESHWRFSYVKMEYAAKANEDGSVGVQTTLTPARRSSYIVGEGESCHTAQSRFLDLLQETKNKPTLAQIEEAFSVEAVTNEFFEQYKALFLELKESLDSLEKKDKRIGAEFAAKKVKTADFAKKLLAQVVFLYFLQRKGWLGVPKGADWGDGPHDFLRQLFARTPRGKNFFNDILEPLFYDTLATDRGHEAWCKALDCRIPFLNGGLFEPPGDYDWRKTEIVIPNSIFSMTTKSGDTGAGILDEFDRYNFTVNEAEPLEKEVAIDPEMLGKVFERLLDVEERKSKGSFYTPREIVHYMCQESLINYLDTAMNVRSESISRAAEQVPLFDGASAEQSGLRASVRRELVPRVDIERFIHSGDQASFYETARVEGTGYNRKLPKTIEEHARLLDDKLEEITVCDPAIGSGAFPVGMMQEIVRARTSLTPYFNDVLERTPYQFKRHAIQNCLYGVDIDPGAVEIAKLRLWLSLVVDEDDVKRIKPLPNLDYKVVGGNSLIGFPYRSARLDSIEKVKQTFFHETDHEKKATLRSQIDRQLHEAFSTSKKSLGYEVRFDFAVHFSEVFRGKGGFDIVLANPPYVDSEQMVRQQEDLRTLYSSIYSTAKGNWDLFVVFIEKGLSLLQPQGTISYIVPNKLIGATYCETLRDLLQQHTICHFRDYSAVRVFREVAVYPVVFTIQKGGGRRDVVMATMTDLETVGSSNVIPPSVFYADNLWGRYLESPETLAILMKCVTHPRLGALLPGISGAATVSEAYALKELIHEHRGGEARRYSRLINTGTVDRYCSLWSRRPTRYLKSTFRAPIVFDADLGRLSQVRLRQAHSQKIVIGGMTLVLECFYDEGECLAGKSTVIILPSGKTNLKYVTAILNSALISFWYRGYYNALCLAGGYLRIGPNEIKTIPIAVSSGPDEEKITKLVDRILVAKQRDVDADVRALEREIDAIVYALYHLTPAEINLVREEGR